MKSSTLIIFLILFGLFYSCNEKTENKKAEFIESKLFGKIKSVETKTFENDTLKSRVLEFYKKNGIIEKKETYFEPNLSSIISYHKYDNENRLINEQIVTNGDSTFFIKYYYNSLGLEKKEEYYLNKLHTVTEFKIDSSRKTIEKKFGYVETKRFRNWKYEYPNENITLTKEFFKSNLPEKITELKIIPEENKKIKTTKYSFPTSESKEIFYHNNIGNLVKTEKYYNGKMTESKSVTYKLDFNQNWIKSESELTRKERIIEYY
ncbi:hypothetical protein QVZ41_14145 [Wenyingzhuangia sp. chi5]|uniref:Lipoprotein n=1 Tax=Wenyingzhuangia gilva TaxID=3057677 RepID=A0ABT8VVI3_9FLAO|nr:hypothetical protein [Wenyingzhuangia sp. chi5]MDO3695989.1 hypothetical protein [Wenyingzhuangia sp. chi5]